MSWTQIKLKKKGGDLNGFTYHRRYFGIVSLCGGYYYCIGWLNRGKKSNQVDKQKLILLGLVLFLVVLPGIAQAFDVSPCHINITTDILGRTNTNYTCDINNQTYSTFSACNDACYYVMGQSQLRVSRHVVELFYLTSGVLLGIFFITSLFVGLK